MSLPVCAIMIVFAAFDVHNYDGELVGVFALLVGFIVCAIPHAPRFYREGFRLRRLGRREDVPGRRRERDRDGAVGDQGPGRQVQGGEPDPLHPAPDRHPYHLRQGSVRPRAEQLNAKRLVWDETTRSARSVDQPRTATDVAGDDLAYLFGLAALWAALVLAVELGEAHRRCVREGHGQDPGEIADADADATEDDPEEDAAERRRVEHLASGGFQWPSTTRTRPSSEDPESNRPLRMIPSKPWTAWCCRLVQDARRGRNEKRAVRDLSVGMARGQCFGLLGSTAWQTTRSA